MNTGKILRMKQNDLIGVDESIIDSHHFGVGEICGRKISEKILQKIKFNCFGEKEIIKE